MFNCDIIVPLGDLIVSRFGSPKYPPYKVPPPGNIWKTDVTVRSLKP